MDYIKASLSFKLKKVFRYIRIFGLFRTIVKIQGQLHMSNTRNPAFLLPQPSRKLRSTQDVAIIGCGNFAFSNIAYYINKFQKLRIRSVLDKSINRAASLANHYSSYRFTDQINDLVSDDGIKLVYIASNHASHCEYAVKCIEAGKDVHIEKPHVVNEEQLNLLLSTMKAHPSSRVFLGFNRPRSPLFLRLLSEINKQSGPLMINWFVAGHELPNDHWYFDEAEGGRVLGNLCHWTDLSLHLVGFDNAFPCTVQSFSPTDSTSDFVFSVIFNDDSCATISFSAKGHTFEGVREVLNVHKGNLIASLSDFQRLVTEVGDEKNSKTLLFRDHGHKQNILNSLTSPVGESVDVVCMSAKFFLAFKRALDTGLPVVVDRPSFDPLTVS